MKRNFRYYLSFLLVSLLCNVLHAEEVKVSPKTKVHHGVLPNGLNYFLYNNPGTPEKANLYLIQNVGAILEDDAQNGLAHFLEHMCFKGTKTFPGREVLNFFESQGAGNAINAFTQMEEIVYYLNDIPVRNQGFFDYCMIVLRDWCNYLELNDEAIEGERPVIVEEIRMRRDLAHRILEQTSPLAYNHTRYGERFIGGTPEIIKTFDKKDLVRFYHDWFRTDLQAVVITGDIDVAEVEQKIKKLFSEIPAVENPRERINLDIPENTETQYAQISDPENRDGMISLYFRHEKDGSTDKVFMDKLVNGLLARRCAELVKQDSLTINSVSMADVPIARGYMQYQIDVYHKDAKAAEALQKALNMQKDVLVNGFSKEEIDFVAKWMKEELNSYQKAYTYMPNDFQFQRIKEAYLNKTELLSPGEELKALNQFLKALSPEMVQAYLQNLYSGTNKSIIVLRNGVDQHYLSKEEVEQIEQNAVPVAYVPDKEEEGGFDEFKLVKKELEEGKITEASKLPLFGAEQWTLDNGAKVVYLENVNTPDQIQLMAMAEGGTSQLQGREIAIAQMLGGTFHSTIGLAGLSKAQMDKLSSMLGVHMSYQVTGAFQSMSATGSYKSIDKLFQSVYAAFDSPVFYPDEYIKAISNLKTKLARNPENFQTQLQDSVQVIKKGADRYYPFSEEAINHLSFDDLQKVFKKTFSDASRFTFYIVGGVGEKKARKMAETYFGSIPSGQQSSKYEPLVNPFPKGYNKRDMYFDMVDEKGGNVYMLNVEKKLSLKEHLGLTMLSTYLQEKLQKLIRDSNGGTYAVMAKEYVEARPFKSAGIDITYECDPARVEEINNMVNAAMVYVQEHGLSELDFNVIKKKYSDMFQMPMMPPPTNPYYMGQLVTYITTGEDHTDPNLYKNAVESLDYAFLNQFFKDYIGSASICNLRYWNKAVQTLQSQH